MAKNDADFYLEGQKITYNKAIKTIEENPEMNISIQSGKGIKNNVEILKDPIKN